MNKLARSPELKETRLEVLGILKVIERRKGLLPFGTGCDYINKFINSSVLKINQFLIMMTSL